MAPQGAEQPKRLEEALLWFTGGDEGATLIYLAKRHLGYEAEEWVNLPWWKRHLYESGLRSEFLDVDGK